MKKYFLAYIVALGAIFLLLWALSGHCQTIPGPQVVAQVVASPKYHWRKVSGGYCTIVSPDSARTVVKNLQQGVYLFEFKITFVSGNVARDTVKVTVLPRRRH